MQHEHLDERYNKAFDEWIETLDPFTRTVVLGIRTNLTDGDGNSFVYKGADFYVCFRFDKLYFIIDSDAIDVEALDEKDVVLIIELAMKIWKDVHSIGITHKVDIPEMSNAVIEDATDCFDLSNGCGIYIQSEYVHPHDAHLMVGLKVNRTYIEETMYKSDRYCAFLSRLVFETNEGIRDIYVGHRGPSITDGGYGIISVYTDTDDE